MQLANVHFVRIIFTSGATDAINLVAESWGSVNLKPDDEVLITVPWRLAFCNITSYANNVYLGGFGPNINEKSGQMEFLPKKL